MAELNYEDTDHIVIKRRYSGFYATDLDLLLRCLNCNAIMLTGVATDGCVQATAMDAQGRDYYVRLVADATYGTGDEASAAAIEAMGRMQSNVAVNSEEALGLLNLT